MITGYIAQGLFQNYKNIEGSAIQTSNGLKTVDPTQGSWVGDVKFRDINNDGVVDNNDRTIIGKLPAEVQPSYDFTTTCSPQGS